MSYNNLSNLELLTLIYDKLEFTAINDDDFYYIINFLILNQNKKYKINKLLGSGENGKVYKVLNTHDMKEYAMKVFKKSPDYLEVDVYMQYKHPNVINGIDMLYNNGELKIITELADYDLEYRIIKYKLSYNIKIKYIFELGDALNFTHNNGMLHCDVKSINVLVSNNVIKLADFGIARNKYIKKINNDCETATYRDIEILLNPEIKSSYAYRRGELWSYGITCLEIIYQISTWDAIWRIYPVEGHIFNFWKSYINKPIGKGRIDYLIESFGPVSGKLKPLLKLVVTHLLTEEKYRIYSFEQFIKNSIFNKFKIQKGDVLYHKEYKVINGINDFMDMIRWMIRFLSASKTNNRSGFLAIELYKNTWEKYEVYKDPDTIIFHSIACIFLANSLWNFYYNPSLDSFSSISTDKGIKDYIHNFLVKEDGIINRLSLYDYLVSKAVQKTMITMLYTSDLYYTTYTLNEYIETISNTAEYMKKSVYISPNEYNFILPPKLV